MGRQVRFRLTDDDIARLEDHLREVGAVFIPARTKSPELAPQATLATPPGMLGLWPDIIRASDLPTARRVYQPTPLADPPADGYWRLDDKNTPVVDYLRGDPQDARGYGRLHFMTDEQRGRRVVPIDPAFVAWANDILKWVRRTFRYDPDDRLYLGPPKPPRSRSG